MAFAKTISMNHIVSVSILAFFSMFHTFFIFNFYALKD